MTKKITISTNGPYRVSGSVPLSRQHIVPDAQAPGDSVAWRQGESLDTGENYALCRCGGSSKKPFCDGTHRGNGFDGTEVASREPYAEQARTIDGPTRQLTDAQPLCAGARFCHPHGGVWNLVRQTDDPQAAALVDHEAGHCPSGRLVSIDRASGRPLEPEHEPSIGLVDDSPRGVAGPLWVRGGVTLIAADGTQYEVRNRVTLCRCGASKNKPFCDGSHIRIGFQDRE